LSEVAVFIVLISFRTWVEAPRACDTADRALLDGLIRHNAVNEKAKAAFITFIHHLWYLGSDFVGFSLFIGKLSTDEKRELMTQMKKEKKLDRKRWVPKEKC